MTCDLSTSRAGLAAAIAAASLAGTALTAQPARADARPLGHDISAHQKHIDWRAARAKGARFVYIKATESHSYRSPSFAAQSRGARAAGLLRGAYHFAVPSASSGTRQARFFLAHGGHWKRDGWTLPPALDIERNPYRAGKPCYGLGRAALVRWIRAFSDEVRRATGRRPVIYTTAPWWNRCTGGSRAFGATHPLWLADYTGAARPPAGWRVASIRQYAARGPLPGDQDRWNGTPAQLRKFANG
ncbi:hydrolase [Streptomyces sp. NRRL F-4489]|uniref:GH25 family lysozyme n=1 Tax=Streptomyces sp. NRRL F-4489 TaxID=1609095 RepID=UPI0007480F4E|nr:GH25 family lysozyme [Streptomyces sp. NRRL F-4489]KUL43093.1 hydrolase [Streptomyces sp. NRRL F-4489]